MNRMILAGLVSALLLLAACSAKAPGSWVVVDTGYGDSYYSVNFVSDQVGWLNGQSGRNPEPEPEDANKNGGKKPAKPPKPGEKKQDPLQANQGFEVLQTTDGGQTWKPIPDLFKNKIRSVWFVDINEGWALTIDRDILHSTDGGMTWTLQRKAGTVELKQPYNRREPVLKQPDQIEQLRFVDNMHGWAWGGGRKDEFAEQPGIFLATVDGGQNWTGIAFAFDQNASDVFFLDAEHGWASTLGGSFYRTTDGGLNWTKVETKLPEDVFRSIFFTDPNSGWVVGRSGRIAKTTDSGRTWRKMWEIKDDFKMRDVFFLDSKRGWVVGEEGAILYTPDAGESWINVGAPIPARLMDINFTGGKTGWTVGLSGAVLKFQPQ
jgi:photosystem II stability/assembly factor-like uncharacterized protein